ncbi:hypothetical protein F5878DRAFT_667112 [Lentinula raphanica]|uniref:Uncharacterized protein n=1 Tax=Lentinula raphanica TaxID=153919 RepID=A0AA38NWJ9_9AGAR|nr:hypothetical protein F5878DRAFT_667112 [Lentinula raphanica]
MHFEAAQSAQCSSKLLKDPQRSSKILKDTSKNLENLGNQKGVSLDALGMRYFFLMLGYALSDKTIKMNYASYHTGIVAKYHIRLIGLPDCAIFEEANGPVKPHNIKDQATLEALFTVLETGTCCWSRMSDNEIKEHSAWLATQEVKERAVRSDKGKKRGSRQRDDDDDDDHDDDDNSENKADSRKRSRKSGVNGKAGRKKSKISKQLPPRSREFVNSDDDESNGNLSD